MQIKEIIGQRIAEQRKKCGLTLKSLAELSNGELTASRIANWEGATRTPGAKEALLLGELLRVAPSYLLGLTDDIKGNVILREPEFKSVPLLTAEQAADSVKNIKNMRKNTPESIQYAPLCVALQNKAHQHYFAFEIQDDSMAPSLTPGDIAIINPEQSPKPGNLVAAIVGTQGVIIRQYKQHGFQQTFEAFELTALNPNWANTVVEKSGVAKIIGVVCQSTHVYS